MRDGWRETHDGPSVTVSRAAGPAPVTVADGWATPAAKDPGRFRAAVAHQVRQDLWRELRSLRGFAPWVAVRAEGDGVAVEAGGRLLAGGAGAERVRAAAAALLADGARRRRWTGFALRRAGGPA